MPILYVLYIVIPFILVKESQQKESWQIKPMTWNECVVSIEIGHYLKKIDLTSWGNRFVTRSSFRMNSKCNVTQDAFTPRIKINPPPRPIPIPICSNRVPICSIFSRPIRIAGFSYHSGCGLRVCVGTTSLRIRRHYSSHYISMFFLSWIFFFIFYFYFFLLCVFWYIFCCCSDRRHQIHHTRTQSETTRNSSGW